MRLRATELVTSALLDAGIGYVAIPGPRSSVRQIAVGSQDRELATHAVRQALTAQWRVTGTGSVLRVSPRVPALAAASVAHADAHCDVAFWDEVEPRSTRRREGGTFDPGTRIAPDRNGVVEYLSPPSWQRALRADDHSIGEQARPTAGEVTEPVDIVYTWVDGADPAWQSRKNAHATDEAPRHRSAVHAARYTSRDELRYSMRSVALYAGWVRRIFIVTDGQTPPWLDQSHPMVEIIDHRQIFRDATVLPVFNSHAIESQLHHIPGLSDRYIYLNDDVFFGRKVEPELFFHGNSHAHFFPSPDLLDADPPRPDDLPAISAAKRSREIIEAKFGVTVRQKIQHGAHAQLRAVSQEMERALPEVFASVASSRFRHLEDVSVASFLHHYWASCTGHATPSAVDYRYQDVGRADTARRLDAILRERPQVFCLNDVDTDPDCATMLPDDLARFFAAYFPFRGPWELAS